jgi:signal transduction histidine kinase
MKIRLNSLQLRIVVLHLVAILIAAVAVPLTNYLVINRSTILFETRTLRGHAEAIGNYLHQDNAHTWHLLMPVDLRTLYAHGLDGLSFQIIDQTGHEIFASTRHGDANRLPLSSNLVRIARNGQLIYGVAVRHGGLWVKVAQNLQHPDVIFDDIVADYLGRIGWFTIAILAALLVADILIVRNALAPVVRASAIASAINHERADLRLPVTGIPRELLPMIVAINDALGRLERGIRMQQEFTADAAHELRTPLAVLRARVDVFPDQPLVSALRSDLEAMTGLVAQLLEIAEVESTVLDAGETADLHAVCSDVISMLADMAIRQNRELALTGATTAVWIHANGAMVFGAVRNLVENAIRHTAGGTTVDVHVTPNGIIQVLDRGPGVPMSDRANIFRRFWRTDRDKRDGTGLGLAIVARVAELHGAKIDVTDRDGGGAIFSIHFNPAQAQPR